MRHFLNDNTSPETTSFHIVASDGSTVAGRASGARSRTALPVHVAAGVVGQPAVSACWRTDSARSSITRRFLPCIRRSSRLHLRFVLSRALHEPVPVGMERRRSQVSVHAPVPSGAEPQPVERGGQAARGRHHRQRPDRAAQPVERQPGEQRHSHQHRQPLAGRPSAMSQRLRQPQDEKRLGDLAIKIYEHFLALFVGTYYRRSLSHRPSPSFIPSACCRSCRMNSTSRTCACCGASGRRRRKLSVFGHPLTPYGPRWLDGMIAKPVSSCAATAFPTRAC